MLNDMKRQLPNFDPDALYKSDYCKEDEYKGMPIKYKLDKPTYWD